jgi:drug/metabolite transporter (DMT)-like permease
MTGSASYAAFATISLIWGLTWIAAKEGVTAVPPLFFTGSRFVVAGLIMAAWLCARAQPFDPGAGLRGRVVLSGLFTNCISPGLIFWGLTHTSAGIGAVINFALIPVGLYGTGLALGEERRRLRLDIAILVGALGLVLLFWPRLQADDHAGMAGLAAIVVGTLIYGVGAVIGRPVMRSFSALGLNATTSLVGGAGLVALSLVVELTSLETSRALFEPRVLIAWLFLVVAGSLIAFTLYLWLLKEWGPARSGFYAFVSPIIALFAASMLLGERVGVVETAGMAAMLLATWIALTRRA